MKLKMNLQTSTMNSKLRWTACQSTLKSARIPPFLVSHYIPFLQHLHRHHPPRHWTQFSRRQFRDKRLQSFYAHCYSCKNPRPSCFHTSDTIGHPQEWNGSAGPEVDRTGVTLSVRLKVKIYGIWIVGYIGITVTSPRKPWARYTHPFLKTKTFPSN